MAHKQPVTHTSIMTGRARRHVPCLARALSLRAKLPPTRRSDKWSKLFKGKPGYKSDKCNHNYRDGMAAHSCSRFVSFRSEQRVIPHEHEQRKQIIIRKNSVQACEGAAGSQREAPSCPITRLRVYSTSLSPPAPSGWPGQSAVHLVFNIIPCQSYVHPLSDIVPCHASSSPPVWYCSSSVSCSLTV